MALQVDILHAKSGKTILTLQNLDNNTTIGEIKKQFQNHKKTPANRQSFRIEPKGKFLQDEDSLAKLKFGSKGKLYFKDLGPQILWKTVFLVEYAGPLFIYLFFYSRPSFIYGTGASSQPTARVVSIAACCWTLHYAKRLLETLFVHRFSHATMPLTNLFKNCSYYYGFCAFVAYFINHPLYTAPYFGDIQIYGGLLGFLFNEYGNFAIHVALRNLRPAGTKERRIPMPTSNPMTALFKMVSCPNYTYETAAWIGFSIMTQCLPAALFTLAGFYQMTVWALGKHRNYKREFSKYPKGRKAIIPLII